MTPRLSPATLATITTAPTEQLQAVANHVMVRLHTETETDFLLATLKELGRRSRRSRPQSLSGSL